MAIEATLSEEEEIRSMVSQGGVGDPVVEETLRATQSQMSMALQDIDFPTIAHLDWVDRREDYAVAIRDAAEEDLEDLSYGIDVFVGRAGAEEVALVADLRSQAAWCDERRAEADALAADARRLRDGYLRKMAGTEDEEQEALVASAAIDFMEFVAKEIDGGGVPEAGDPARADEIHAAARTGGVGARFAAMFVGLAERLRRHAGAYDAGEDRAVAEALRRRAAEVEALCADPEAFVPRMLATGCWRLWRYVNQNAGYRLPRMLATEAQPSMPAAPTPIDAEAQPSMPAAPTPPHPL